MITEIVKLCGLSGEDIEHKLAAFSGRGIDFKVRENCLDAAVIMNSALPRDEFERIKSLIYNLFEESVYAAEDCTLHELAARLLKLNGRTLSVAESLTGGEICARLAGVPGISANFFEGIVCYNKLSKMRRLGVSKALLNEYGAISRETALAMVKGITVSPADIGLATTGLAGPEGDEGKPVGLVYIGVGAGDFITVFEKRFSGDRAAVRNSASNMALFYLVRYLKSDILRL